MGVSCPDAKISLVQSQRGYFLRPDGVTEDDHSLSPDDSRCLRALSGKGASLSLLSSGSNWLQWALKVTEAENECTVGFKRERERETGE